ncbi:family 78 glycoside hydrolase catalytic domain [Enterococcus faecium]|uniref:family 78 glycoside hydrolase catalytic domain n=1 Tax=Enterococcus faecium TaxID=1352 RepID=UPI00241445AD|nr:family 78 glycoside hydrolase catalytic domain [Enterococcus faecium]MDG4589235.1 family 78 glycoside hydrolase catalytic domain [Enterococcus faecium]
MENCTDLITINGKYTNYAVDVEESIIINWSRINIIQKKAQLYIMNEDQDIVLKQEIGNKKFSNVKFPTISDQRKKYLLHIIIEGEESIQEFHTTFYSANSNLKNAHWITRQDHPIEKENMYYRDRPSIILKKSFIVERLEKDLFLDICGLGYYTTYINGKRIDDYYLNSDVTNYGKQVYYDTYKLNPFVEEGSNEIIVELANGWYNPAPLKLLGKYNMRHRLSIGKPMLICSISELANGKQRNIVESNHDWLAEGGEILFDNIYIGERVSFVENEESNPDSSTRVNMRVTEIVGPAGKLVPSTIPKTKRLKKRKPNVIKKTKYGYLIDFGKIISGQISLTISSKKQNIKINYAESLNDSQTELDYSTTTTSIYGVNDPEQGINESDTVIQEDQFLCGDGKTTFENMYVYHSFRYMKVEGECAIFDINDLHAFDTYADLTITSEFNTSNQLLNDLQRIAIQTKRNNIRSYYEDCARERLGYGGDIVALIESQIYSFDSEQLLKKVLLDFIFDQTLEGGITQTAPFMGIQTFGPSNNAGSLGWQLVLPVIVLKYMKYYGMSIIEDKRISVSLNRHLNYLLKFDYEYIKYCCLGDWGSVDTVLINNKETPPDKEFCSAAMYLIVLQSYQKLAVFTKGMSFETEKLEEKIRYVKEKLIKEYYNSKGYFQGGSQSSYIFSLKAGLDKEFPELLQKFKNQIREDDGVFKMGIFGMAWSYEILDDQDLIYQWLTRKNYPSFYSMVSNNSGALGEYFKKMNGSSLNHAMFTSYSQWFISTLLGIKFDQETQESTDLLIDPYIPDDIEFAEGTLRTIHGEIGIGWEKTQEKTMIKAQIPSTINYRFSKEFKVNSKTIIDGSWLIEAIKR